MLQSLRLKLTMFAHMIRSIKIKLFFVYLSGMLSMPRALWLTAI